MRIIRADNSPAQPLCAAGILGLLLLSSLKSPPCEAAPMNGSCSDGHAWSGPAVKTGRGGLLSINGRLVAPLWLKVGGEDPLEGAGPDRWANVNFTLQRATAEGRVPIVAFATDRWARNSSAYEPATDWAVPLSNRTLHLLATVVANAPGALLYPTIYPYFNTHGDGSCVVPGQPCAHTILRDGGNTTRRSFANSPSPDWARAVAAVVRRYLCALDRLYPGRVLGLQLNGLETGGTNNICRVGAL